jgi:hypothetical protein
VRYWVFDEETLDRALAAYLERVFKGEHAGKAVHWHVKTFLKGAEMEEAKAVAELRIA